MWSIRTKCYRSNDFSFHMCWWSYHTWCCNNSAKWAGHLAKIPPCSEKYLINDIIEVASLSSYHVFFHMNKNGSFCLTVRHVALHTNDSLVAYTAPRYTGWINAARSIQLGSSYKFDSSPRLFLKWNSIYAPI